MNARTSERTVLALWIATAAFAVTALAALVARPSLDGHLPDEAAGTLAGDSAFVFPTLPEARATDAARVIQFNLFAAARRPPARRYTPSEPEPVADAATLPSFDAGMPADVPTLLGTVLEAGGARALLEARTDSGSEARFYGAGERVGAYRVRRVEAGRVLLDGPSGPVTLHLIKPNEERP